MNRQTWKDIAPDRCVNRQTYVDEIVQMIQQVQRTAVNMRKELAASTVEVRNRLIVLKGGAGVGKSVLLEMLAEELSKQFLCRTTRIINIKEIVDSLTTSSTDPPPSIEFDTALSQVCEQCAGTELLRKDVSECSLRMKDALNAEGNLVIVLMDDLEALNNPLFRTDDPERDQRVLAVKNLLLRPLLQLFHIPVILIAAARAIPGEQAMLGEPLPYFSELDFQDAMKEIPIENTELEVNQVLGITRSDSRTQGCGGSLLVAAERGPHWGDQAVKRMLIDEFMSREPVSQRGYFEALLTLLSRWTLTPITQITITRAAVKLHLPLALRKRITARLVASSYLVNDGAKYQVYPPLADLLRSKQP